MEFRPWYYLQESVHLKVLLTESFQDKKKQFLKQGATLEEIEEYFNIFRKIQNSNYKKVADVMPGLMVAAPHRKNIDMYPNFDQLKIFVDYMRSQENLEVDIEVVGKPIFENNVLEISYADSPKACITYRGDVPYSWCVSRKTQNVYNTYRFQPNEPSFYFVKNKIRTKKELSSWNPEDINEKTQWKDPWHFFIIQVNLGADVVNQNAKQYVVTSARNDGDKPMSWSQILQLEPALNGLQQRFKPVALPDEDRAFVKRWQNGATDEEFAKMGFKEKSKFMSVYVRLGRGLTDNQFASLPPSLWNEYLNFSVGLTDKQFDMIKDKRELVKRYTELSIRKFNDLVTEKVSLKYLSPSEWKMLKNQGESLDWDKMSDNNFSNSFDDATDKQTMLDLRLKHRKELSVSNVESILLFTPDLSTIEQTLGQENLNKINQLDDDQIYGILRYGKDEKGVIQVILNHKELTLKNIQNILRFSPDVKNIEEILGTKNLEKINLSHDDEIHFLLRDAKDEKGVIQVILNHKEELTQRNVFDILKFSKDVKAIEEQIGKENLKKIKHLGSRASHELLRDAQDLEGVIDLLLNYKELTSKDVELILRGSQDLKAIEGKLGEENLKKINSLDDDTIHSLLYSANDKEGMINLLLNHRELTPANVYVVLKDSEDVKAIAKKLGEKNLKKIDIFVDTWIDLLIGECKDKQAVIDLILTYYRTDFTLENVYMILRFSHDVKTVAAELGEENLKKVHSWKIKDLLDYAEDREGIRYVINKYGLK